MPADYPEYTDLQRTRVVARKAGTTRTNPSIGGTQPLNKPERLMDGLSLPQLIAGAAAAATSVALASKIGVYGSVIGAAVSSVVTVVATQVYRHAISAGARKLKSETPQAVAAYRTAATSPATLVNERHDGETTLMPQVRATNHAARIAPTKLQARAAARQAAVQKKVALASVGIAVAAVLICAGLIWLFTAGQGLGDRPASVLFPDTAATTSTANAPDESSGTTANTDGTTGPSDTAGTDNAQGAQESSSQSASSGTASSGTGGDTSSSTDNKSTSSGNQSKQESSTNTSESTGTGSTGASKQETSSSTSSSSTSSNEGTGTTGSPSGSEGTGNAASSTTGTTGGETSGN